MSNGKLRRSAPSKWFVIILTVDRSTAQDALQSVDIRLVLPDFIQKFPVNRVSEQGVPTGRDQIIDCLNRKLEPGRDSIEFLGTLRAKLVEIKSSDEKL